MHWWWSSSSISSSLFIYIYMLTQPTPSVHTYFLIRWVPIAKHTRHIAYYFGRSARWITSRNWFVVRAICLHNSRKHRSDNRMIVRIVFASRPIRMSIGCVYCVYIIISMYYILKCLILCRCFIWILLKIVFRFEFAGLTLRSQSIAILNVRIVLKGIYVYAL